MAEYLLELGTEPICPRCGYRGFDDWWHILKQHVGEQPHGRLKCGECEKIFTIQGSPGNVASSAYGVRNA